MKHDLGDWAQIIALSGKAVVVIAFVACAAQSARWILHMYGWV